MSSVTNLDLHDIARACECYGVSAFFVITPDKFQQQLVTRITRFWESSEALLYNPHRSEALDLISCCDSLADCQKQITNQEGVRPLVITTTAKSMPEQLKFPQLRILTQSSNPVLLCFGTGYGLCSEIHETADHILEPITGRGSYNHLSVRSAVAIVLDRSLSEDINGRNHGYSANNRQRPNQNRLPRLSRRRYG